MVKLVRTSLLLAVILTVGMSTSCKDKNKTVAPFDKASLLTNLADNLIIPAVNDFTSRISTLESDYIAFQADRTTQKLETVRESWKAAYLSWQRVKMYDFGPMRTLGIKGGIGTFPTDTTKIENNISSGSYILASAANADAIGLSALDYFLHRIDALSYFVGNDAYTTYGLEVIQKMKSEMTLAQSQWAGYRATFIASTGTETTSAFSELINEFNRDYELAKNAKLGIPLGKQSLGIQLPKYLEARRSGLSLDLLKENIIALHRVYTGSDNSGNPGVGFDDYLIHLERSTLSSTIISNFTAIQNKINSMSGTMEQEMGSNVAGLDALYALIQGQVVNLKTDMTSAFGVLITYQDNDGD